MQSLAAMTGDAVAMYGRQFDKKMHIQNSGVMVMNVKEFRKAVPLMLDHIKHWGEEEYKDHTENGIHDQSLINNYRGTNDTTMKKFTQLPMHYNWKPYWGLEPSTFAQVKIIHFHGPKPENVLGHMGKCNLTWEESLQFLKEPYGRLFDEGVCCDKGRTADWSIHAMDVLKTPMQELL